MSSMVRRPEYSLYLLGYESEILRSTIEDYWFALSPNVACPPGADELVATVRQSADELYEHFGEDPLGEIAHEISDAAAVAWSHFQDSWHDPQHAQASDVIARVSEHEIIPEDWWSNATPLHDEYWGSLQGLLVELTDELEPLRRIYLRLGRLIGQAVARGITSSAEPQSIEGLRTCFELVRSHDPSFTDLHWMLSEAFRPQSTRARRDFEREQVENLHREVLSRLNRSAGVSLPGSSIASAAIEIDNVPRSTPARREPHVNAFRAYQLWLGLQTIGGRRSTQERLAEILSAELRRRITQSTVSRWLRSVREWLEVGNLLPILSPAALPDEHIVDPDVLNRGDRLDHRTVRQRSRSSDD
jgi:hypothetical protein